MRDGSPRRWQLIGSHWHTFVVLGRSLEIVGLVLRNPMFTSRCSPFLVSKDPSAPMGMEKHTLAGLAIVGLVNSYRDMARRVSRRKCSICSACKVGGRWEGEFALEAHLAVGSSANLMPARSLGRDTLEKAVHLLGGPADILRTKFGGIDGQVTPYRHGGRWKSGGN